MCDDGSGGHTAYLTLDGSATRIDISKFMRFADGVEARFGAQSDLQIHHDGSNSYITQNGTGDLYIKQMTADKDLVFQCDNGAGGDATYFFLDGSLADGTYTYTKWPDNSAIALGSSNDLVLWHDGGNSYIRQVGTGHLHIENITDDKDIIFKSDDGSGGTTEYFRLDGSEAQNRFFKNVKFDDNVEARFGTGNDLKLYHDGNHSYISQDGTGHLYIRQTTADSDVILQCDNGSGSPTQYIQLDGSDVSTVIHTIKVLMPNLPTSDPSVAGQLWNDSGTLKISAG